MKKNLLPLPSGERAGVRGPKPGRNAKFSNFPVDKPVPEYMLKKSFRLSGKQEKT